MTNGMVQRSGTTGNGADGSCHAVCAGRGQRADSAGQLVVIGQQADRQFHHRLLRPQGARLARGRRRAAERAAERATVAVRDQGLQQRARRRRVPLRRRLRASRSGVGLALLAADGAQRLRAAHARGQHGDRAGAQAAADPGDVHRPLPAAAARQRRSSRTSAAALVAIRYRYSEVGEFVADNRDIFPARYIADGTAVGPTVLAGLRAPVRQLVGRRGSPLAESRSQGARSTKDSSATSSTSAAGPTNFTFGVQILNAEVEFQEGRTIRTISISRSACRASDCRSSAFRRRCALCDRAPPRRLPPPAYTPSRSSDRVVACQCSASPPSARSSIAIHSTNGRG